jgi:hypothetical protein
MGLTSSTMKFGVLSQSTLDSLTASTSPTINQSGFDHTIELTATTTPDVEIASYQTLAAGTSGSIDLTAVPTANGTVSASGKKLRGLMIRNKSTGKLTVNEGASNGYSLDGNVLVIPTGGTGQLYFADGLGAVGASDKILDYTLTVAGNLDIILLFG